MSKKDLLVETVKDESRLLQEKRCFLRDLCQKIIDIYSRPDEYITYYSDAHDVQVKHNGFSEEDK